MRIRLAKVKQRSMILIQMMTMTVLAVTISVTFPSAGPVKQDQEALCGSSFEWTSEGCSLSVLSHNFVHIVSIKGNIHTIIMVLHVQILC